MTPERKEEIERCLSAMGRVSRIHAEELLAALDSRDSQISALLADNARLRTALVEVARKANYHSRASDRKRYA